MDAVIFILGFFLGAIVIIVGALIYISKTAKKAGLVLDKITAEKNQAIDNLKTSEAESNIFKERASALGTDLLFYKDKAERLTLENKDLVAKVSSLTTHNEKSVEFFNQRIADLSALKDHMKEAFAIVSKDALSKNAELINSSFKQSMEHFFKTNEKDRNLVNENLVQVMGPLKESLEKVDKKIADLETRREGAYAGLKEQVDGLIKSQALLQKETQHLSRALTAPTIRGRWGEMQLKRVVELSGMSPHCDFLEQKSIQSGEDVLRPDMIITLPKNKKVVVDAKAPLDLLSSDGDRKHFALALRRHLLGLKKKSYYSVISESPEFVVMFLPGEVFLHEAMLADPLLLDYAAQNEIIVATPVTLIALLKAVAFSFKQEAIASNIEEVRKLSQQLIDRVGTVSVHFEKLGKSLKQATLSYNQTLASLDSRVLVTARKLSELKLKDKDSELLEKPLPMIDTLPTSKFESAEEKDLV